MKNKAFILDFNLLEEHNISAEEFLLLIGLKDNNISGIKFNEFDILQKKQFIKINESGDYILREKGKLLLELCEIENDISTSNEKFIKKSSRAINLELNEFIQEFRALWKGLKPGSMGSEKSCRDKMYRWMQENPSYDKTEILKAAKIYINSIDNLKYLQRADYFIFKREGTEESSQLSAFIDEIDNKIVEDWTSKIN